MIILNEVFIAPNVVYWAFSSPEMSKTTRAHLWIPEYILRKLSHGMWRSMRG
jgi:hypothetical protein